MAAAALVATVFLGTLTLFQIALAVGAPWGSAAWGGQNPGILPPKFRIASGFAAVAIYPYVILLVLGSADVAELDWLPGTGRLAMWVLVGFFTLGTLANLASRSKTERIWGPVTLIIAACCGVIALSL